MSFTIHTVGTEVELKKAMSAKDGSFYPKGTRFEIIREVWPDTWVLKDPFGRDHEVLNMVLCEDFEIVQKPKSVPVPRALEKWYKQVTKVPRG